MGKKLLTTPRSKVRADSGIPKRDITGLRSGKLTVIKFSHMDQNGHGSVWECRCDCGNTHFTRGTHVTQNKTQSCGCLRKAMFASWRQDKSGSDNPMWKGGKTHDKEYIKLLTPLKDRFGKPKYIFEHRFVMSQKIGRPLEAWEVVHHKNGIKDDNRIENLELLTKNNHKGNVVCPHCNKSFFIR